MSNRRVRMVTSHHEVLASSELRFLLMKTTVISNRRWFVRSANRLMAIMIGSGWIAVNDVQIMAINHVQAAYLRVA